MKKFLIQRILCKASSRTIYLTMNLPQQDCKMKKAKKPRQQINPNNPNLLPLMSLLPLSINVSRIQDAPQRKKRRSSCSNCWVIRDWSLHFYTAGLFMGGSTQTSTHDVTARTPQSPCSKSWAQVNASAATPTLSGHHLIYGSLLVIVVRCCSTCLAKGTSQTKEQAKRYTVAANMGLVFMEVITASQLHIMNHLMVMDIANHMQISLVIVSQLMVLVQTCSLTTRI